MPVTIRSDKGHDYAFSSEAEAEDFAIAHAISFQTFLKSLLKPKEVTPSTYKVGMFSPGVLPENRSYRSCVSVLANSESDAIERAKNLVKSPLIFHFEVLETGGKW